MGFIVALIEAVIFTRVVLEQPLTSALSDLGDFLRGTFCNSRENFCACFHCVAKRC